MWVSSNVKKICFYLLLDCNVDFPSHFCSRTVTNPGDQFSQSEYCIIQFCLKLSGTMWFKFIRSTQGILEKMILKALFFCSCWWEMEMFWLELLLPLWTMTIKCTLPQGGPASGVWGWRGRGLCSPETLQIISACFVSRKVFLCSSGRLKIHC